MKKILMIIAAVLVVAATVTGIWFASVNSFTSVDYEVVNSEARITEIIYSGRKIEIPETVDGFTVTSVAPWAISSNNHGFPDSKPSWFINMFEGVTVYIPKTVTSLESQAFCSCFDVTRFKVDKDNKYFSADSEGVLYNKDKTELIQYPLRKTDKSYTTHENTVKIGDYAFMQAAGIEEVIIGEGVKEIEIRAFQSIYNLKKVSLPESLEIIGEDAFYSHIKEINIPNGLKKIEAGAFRNCDLPDNVVLSENLAEISDYIFGDSSDIKKITIGASVGKINFSSLANCENIAEITVDEENKYFSCDGKGAVYNKDMTELVFCANAASGDFVIPDGVIKIASGAFKDCVKIKSIAIPASVISIGEEAFVRSRIEKAVFANGSAVKEIPTAAFFSCGNLREVVLPQGLKVIGKGAFDGCEKLTDIEIPAGVEKIESSAFVACESISEITVPDSVVSIGKNAFGYNIYSTGAYKGRDAISPLASFRIRCTENSAAAEYAEENGFEINLIK